jgi:hypothetical protein
MPERPQKLSKLLKRGTYGLLLILALLFAFSRVEKWRGSRSWEAAKAELKASGLTVDWAEAIPTPIPDDQNLAMARVLTGCYRAKGKWSDIGNWQAEPVFDEAASEAAEQAQELYAPHKPSSVEDAFGFPLSETESLDVFGDSETERFAELAQVLAPYRASLKELRDECAKRPESYLPGDYTISSTAPIPNFQVVRNITRLLTAEAVLALHEGDTTLVLDNCKALNRIANLNPETPFMVNVMIKAVVLRSFMAEILWHGISEDAFSEAQLREIIDLCRQNDPVRDLGRSFEAEMLFAITTVQEFNENPEMLSLNFGHKGTPLFLSSDQVFNSWIHRILWYLTPAEGWNLQMSLRHIEFSNGYRSAFDLNQRTIDLAELDQMAVELKAIEAKDTLFDSTLLMGGSPYHKIAEVAVETQRRLDLLEIAATLSLSAKQGNPLPESITSGREAFPTDPTNGQAYSYRKTKDGFTISSERQDNTEATKDDLIVNWTPKQR